MRSTTMVKNYEKKMRNLQYNCHRTHNVYFFCQENFAWFLSSFFKVHKGVLLAITCDL